MALHKHEVDRARHRAREEFRPRNRLQTSRREIYRHQDGVDLEPPRPGVGLVRRHLFFPRPAFCRGAFSDCFHKCMLRSRCRNRCAPLGKGRSFLAARENSQPGRETCWQSRASPSLPSASPVRPRERGLRRWLIETKARPTRLDLNQRWILRAEARLRFAFRFDAAEERHLPVVFAEPNLLRTGREVERLLLRASPAASRPATESPRKSPALPSGKRLRQSAPVSPPKSRRHPPRARHRRSRSDIRWRFGPLARARREDSRS